MTKLASTTQKRFLNLIDMIAEPTALSADAGSLQSLGPSVGDDAGLPLATTSGLGPSVGDDGLAPASRLGPSVGDDLAPSAAVLTVLGPSLGDDTPSDLRLKEDVRCVGSTVFGLPVYEFKYRGRPEMYEGVMAQDVLRVMPSAVSVAADGYFRVNYSALGTSMRRVS